MSLKHAARTPYAGLEYFRVYTGKATHVIHVPLGQGGGVCDYLLTRRIASRVSSSDQVSYDRIEVGRDVSALALHDALGGWGS